MDPPDADRELGRGDRPADPPASHGVGLRQRVDGDGPLGHPRQGRERDVRALVDDVLVYVVGQGDEVVLAAEVGDQLQLVLAKDLARRVVRRVDDDRPRPRGDRRAKLIGIDRPVRLVQRDVAGDGSGQDRVGAVVLIERLEDDHLVARVEQPEHRRDHPLGRTAGHRDLRLRIDHPAGVEAGGLRCDGIAERLRAPGDRVLVHVRIDRGGGGRFQLRRTGEVGKALGEADRPRLDRQAVHVADDRLREGRGLAADRAHGAECTGRPRVSRGGSPARGDAPCCGAQPRPARATIGR